MDLQVIYTTTKLVIELPTHMPADLHAHLLMALNVVFKQTALYPPEREDERFAISQLAELQKVLLPNELALRELKKMHNH